MTEEALIEILQKHDSVLSGPMLIKDIISAMREAVQRGIDEYVATQKGHVFDIWEIEQRRKLLEAVEKGSIEFYNWQKNNPAVMSKFKYFTTDQLYNEYLKTL